MSSKQEQRRKRIYEFYLANRSKGKKFTLDHFRCENVARQTVSDIIKRAENDSGHERVQGSGRVAKIMTSKNIKRLKIMFDHRDGVSIRQAARKFNCSNPYILKTLASKTEIEIHKKKKIPKRTEDQRERIRRCSDRLYRKLQGKHAILDDESYFTLAHSTINGNDNFYSSDISKTPASVKYRENAKFEKKLLVWVCASEKGISKPYFVPSGLAVNKNVYLEQCVKKRLLPFINAYHSDGQYLFWPDLASSHYAKTVTDHFETEGINYVLREENPPNVPEARPIEDFWGLLKGKVYENNWQAENIQKLEARIKFCLKKIDFETVKALFESTRVRVGKLRTKGVIESN